MESVVEQARASHDEIQRWKTSARSPEDERANGRHRSRARADIRAQLLAIVVVAKTREQRLAEMGGSLI